MNREIKFRAWHKDLKKMFKIGQITLEEGTWNFEPNDRGFIGMSIPYQTSFVLMQYTGLHDKNGKEIYEGDIVKDVDDGKIGVIKFIENMTGFFLVYGECISSICEVEVIGNVWENGYLLKARINEIHDNPELLKEVK